MSEAEYIAVLWRIIGVEAAMIAALVAVVWHHILEDRKVRADLDKCKAALGINGGRR